MLGIYDPRQDTNLDWVIRQPQLVPGEVSGLIRGFDFEIAEHKDLAGNMLQRGLPIQGGGEWISKGTVIVLTATVPSFCSESRRLYDGWNWDHRAD